MSEPERKTILPEEISREPLLRSYIENMVTYLSRDAAFLKKFDGKDVYGNNRINADIEDYIRQIVIEQVKGSIKVPKVHLIKHEVCGEAAEDRVDLLKFTKATSKKIVTPSGSVYKTAKEHPSFLREKIIEDKAGRSHEKKLMFEAKAAGDTDKENTHNNNQSLLKIGMNSIIGAMGSFFSFLSDIAGFNSVTSTSRFLIMNAYAQTERLLEANFYFPTVEHAINHIVICCRSCPGKETIEYITHKYNLFQPDWGDVYELLNTNYCKYNPDNLPPYLSDMLMRMPQFELTYIYYFSNLKNIILGNSDKFRAWINDFFDEEKAHAGVDMDSIDPKVLYKLDGMLVTLLSTVHGEWLPLEASGKKVSIYDTVTAYPDIAKRFICIGNYMQHKLNNEFNEIFYTFLDNGRTVPNTIDHKNMFRNCVILSDTDSVVFTTKSWLKWYTNEYQINNEAYKINSLVVYWLSKAIVFILKNVSIHRGALGADVGVMQMKNEFFYPIMVQSSLKKHYAGLVAVQEGVVLPKLKSDIKGINFRGSKLATETTAFVKDYIDETNTLLITHGKVSARERIWKLVEFEQRVYKSVKAGELRFLNVIPVKNADEYEDEERSIYFNYLFWEAVFANKYGSIMIPSKCYSLPLMNINDPAYMEFLERTDKDIFDNLKYFISLYPKKKITRIPINPVTDGIPAELMPVVNFRQIINDNSSPIALFLKSFGISLGNNAKSRLLFSEVYGSLN